MASHSSRIDPRRGGVAGSVGRSHRARLLCWAAVLSSLPVAAYAETFVCAGSSIRVFADDATAGDLPLRVIEGPTTGITECYDVALDILHGEVWVSRQTGISAFRATATGDVAPLRTISGATTQIGFANTVAVDVEAGEVLVGSTQGCGVGGRVLTFLRTASGDVAPLRAISGLAGGLCNPIALFVDRIHGELFVADFQAFPGVFVYDRLATGSDPPIRTLIGFSNEINHPRGLFVDPRADELYISESDPNVLVYTRDSANSGTYLRGLAGGGTQLVTPWGLSVTDTGELLVGDQSSVSTTPDPLYAFANTGALGNSPPLFAPVAGAPGSRNLYGITSSRALACGAGRVVSACLFRDGFEDSDASDWSAVVGLVP